MEVVEGGFETTTRDMRVAIGRADVLVPEHLLNEPKIGAVFEKMRRERVAKRMGRDRLLDASGKSVGADT